MSSYATSITPTYARAVEAEPSVTITDVTFFGHGWQPTTIATLQALWFMPQGVTFTVDELAAWFGQLGWKSTNGRPFGVEGVRRELALIRQAGYIQAVRLRGEGGRVTGIRYEVSKRPSVEVQAARPWIPIQGLEEETPRSHHVPLPTGDGGRPEKVGNGNRRSRHVPSATGDGRQPEMVGKPFSQVAPCAVADGSPPHPPEEVDTSSPNPHTQPAAPAGEEEVGFSPEETAAAERFLQTLPAPWNVGRQTAKRQAPKLLDAARAQGWQLDQELVVELTKNPVGVKNFAAVLKTRIADLPLRSVVATPQPSRRSAAPAPAADLPAWCEDLDCDEETRRRTFTDDRGFTFTGPCPDCHPDSRTRLDAA